MKELLFQILIGMNIGVGICYICDKIGYDWKKNWIDY